MASCFLLICSFKPKAVESKYNLIAFNINSNANIPSILPIEEGKINGITSHYGMRYNPIVKKKKMHDGVDIKAPKGTQILATADGIIDNTSFSNDYGNHIKIKHNDSFTTMYAHLESMSVKKGQKIKKGDVIGIIGTTGKSLGIHLHYEVIKNSKKVNPADYFQYEVLHMK